jgi:hypothetical protein
VLGKPNGPGVATKNQAKEVGGDSSVFSIVSRFARVRRNDCDGKNEGRQESPNMSAIRQMPRRRQLFRWNQRRNSFLIERLKSWKKQTIDCVEEARVCADPTNFLMKLLGIIGCQRAQELAVGGLVA